MLQLLNQGQKWIPTPCRDTRICTIQQQTRRWYRNIRLRAMFGSTPASKYHVPHPGFQPETAAPEVEQFIADVDEAIMACYQHKATLLRMRPIHSNVSPVLAEAITHLKGLRDVIIKPADKNMGLVVLDKEWYQGECARLLEDPSVYVEVPAEQMPQVIHQLRHALVNILGSWKHAFPAAVHKYLLASTHAVAQVPHFYLLPKVHKMQEVTRAYLHQLKGRPIAANHSWITTAASIYLADMLNEACYRQFPQVLPNSTTLVKLLESSVVSAEAYLVTFDIENMYPCIDNDAAIEACTGAVPSQRGMVHELLSFVMHNGYCQNRGRYFKQVKGTVTGTNVAPPYANIYVAVALEAAVKQQVPYWPAIYKRFIDDGFFVWEQDLATLHAFLQLMNTLVPNIKLTWHIDQQSVPYMDLLITKHVQGATATLSVSTFQKPHNRYLYIPYDSFHRRAVFKGFVKAELLRYAVTNTQEADYSRMKGLFYQRLRARGYPAAVLDNWFAQVQHSDRAKQLDYVLQRAANSPKSVPPVLVLPNGQFEMSISLATVINNVYARHKHHEAVAALFGGANARLLVAYSKNQSLGARFVKASH